AGALGATGVYELVDRLAGSSPKRVVAGALPPEQHVLDGLRVITDNGVEVTLPPLHHQVVTARVGVGLADLRDAQRTLEAALAKLDTTYAPTPAGLGVTFAWGLSYFERFVSAQLRLHALFVRRAEELSL